MTQESEDKKEQRAREGAQAWADYQAERRAFLEKTARLRALRLARDAAIKNPVITHPIGDETGWTTARSLGEYTRSQYSPVMIALFSMKFIAPPSRIKRGRQVFALSGNDREQGTASRCREASRR